MKKQEGITLIALVITIIVLLILAGVTIAMLTGENGLLTRASDAKTQNEYAGIQDKVQLAIQSVYADTLTPGSSVSAVTEANIVAQYNLENGSASVASSSAANQLTITEGSISYTVTLKTLGDSKTVDTIVKN